MSLAADGRFKRDSDVGATVRRADLDGLRALAIVPVVLHHAGVSAVPGGFVGVDVFFVLSGYLITRLIVQELDAGTFSLTRFYERRVRRILPALVVVVLACLVVGWVSFMPAAFDELARSAIAALLSVSNMFFWRDTGDYFAPDAEFLPLLHTWSLGVEEQFYLLYPLLLLALWRFGRRAVFPVLAVLTAVSLTASAVALPTSPEAAFYLAPSRAFELGIGGLLVFLPPMPARFREVAAAAGLGAILLAVFAFDYRTPFPGLAALLPCLGAAAIIQAGTAAPTAVSRVLALRPLVFVGLISYSLYLWHWPVLAFVSEWFGMPRLPFAAAAPAVALGVLLAVLSWRFVETPFRRRRTAAPRRFFLVTAAAIAAPAALAAVVIARDGMPSRLSPEIVALMDAGQGLAPPEPGGSCFDRLPPKTMCILGTEAPPSFLLWGDSHAVALATGIDDAAQISDVSGVLAASPGCAPVLGLLRPRRPGCDPIIALALDTLEQRPEITTVILLARWSRYAADVPEPFTGRVDDKSPIDDPDLPGVPADDDQLSFGLVPLVEQLVASGRRVVLVAEAPAFPFDVPKALVTRARLGLPLPATIDLDAYARQVALVEPTFARLDALPGVDVLGFEDVLCRPECLTEFEGRPVYKDDDHISNFAARRLLGEPLAARIWPVP